MSLRASPLSSIREELTRQKPPGATLSKYFSIDSGLKISAEPGRPTTGDSDLAVGDHHRAHGGAAALLHPVGGEKGGVLPFENRRIGEQVAGEQDTLAAEAGHEDIVYTSLFLAVP